MIARCSNGKCNQFSESFEPCSSCGSEMKLIDNSKEPIDDDTIPVEYTRDREFDLTVQFPNTPLRIR